jgi:hypothetical protein
MNLKAYFPRSRKMHLDVKFDATRGIVTLRHGQTMPSRKLVLLPDVGLKDGAGEAVFLGDLFKRTVDGREETFFVGPLPPAGVLVSGFELVPYTARVSGKLVGSPDALPLTQETLAGLQRVANVFVRPETVVPEKSVYCYHSLGWDGSYLRGVACPFYVSSDHGMVYCRLKQLGSLTAEAGERSDAIRQRALDHFGSEEAVDAANQVDMLWDQCKVCGVNDDWHLAEDEPE